MLSSSVILFDGYCNLCSSWVNFILKHDKKKQFRFCALQSLSAEKLLTGLSLTEKNKTVVLLTENKAHLKSTAALNIFKKLGGFWSLLYIFIIVPRIIRDAVYDFIARHRYKWFGKRNQCYLPSAEERNRFIETEN